MARSMRSTVLAAMVLLLGGCGSSTTVSPAASSAPTPAPSVAITAAPTPTLPSAASEVPAASKTPAATETPAASPAIGLAPLASQYAAIAAKGEAAIARCDKVKSAALELLGAGDVLRGALGLPPSQP